MALEGRSRVCTKILGRRRKYGQELGEYRYVRRGRDVLVEVGIDHTISSVQNVSSLKVRRLKVKKARKF